MSLPIADFWNLATQSRLLAPPECQRLAAEFAAQVPGAADAAPLAEWLVKRQVISPFHAKVLLAKRPGPFFYGDYKVQDRVDKGRLVGTFKAVHQPTNHSLGLHFLSGPVASDKEALAMFSARCASAARVRHPLLWTCYPLVDLGAFKLVPTAWHEGQALQEALPKDKPLPPVEACRLARQAALALAELHKAGLPHGDIRPANLWLDKSGNLKLLHAPFVPEPLPPSQRPADQREAAADYLAPEIASGSRPADASADIYALGCTLYQLLCGRTPFAEGDAASKQQRHAGQAAVALDKVNNTIPRALAQVVELMMAKDSAKRYQQPQKVADALSPFVPPAKAALPSEPLTAEGQAFEQYLRNPRPAPAGAAPVSAAPVAVSVAPTAVAVPQGNGHPVAQAVSVAPRVGTPVAGGAPVARAVAVGPTAAAPVMAQAVPVGGAVMAQAAPVQAMPLAAAPLSAQPAGVPGFSAIPAVSGLPGGISTTRRLAARRKKSNGMLIGSAIAVLLIGGTAAALVLPKFFTTRGDVAATDGTGVPATTVSVDKVPGGDKPGDGGTTKPPKAGDGIGSADGPDAAQSDPSTERLMALDEDVWRSPTHGQPLDLAYFPSGVKAYIALRPAEILKHEQGSLVLSSLGPAGELLRDTLKSMSGLPPENIEQATLGLVDSLGDRPPSLALVVHSLVPVDEEARAAWNSPEEETIADTKVYLGGDNTYLLPDNDDDKLLVVWGMKDAEKLTEWLEGIKAGPIVFPNFELIARSTDRDRHVTILFQPDFFTFGGGKDVFTGPAARMKGPLMSFLMETSGALPRAAVASAHLDEDLFLEFMAYGTAADEPLLVAKAYRDRVGDFGNSFETYMARLTPHDYGQRVLIRFPRMLQQMGYHTVAATDEKQKLSIVRCYLPALAAHNLALATQLAVLEAPGGAVAVASTGGGNTPKTVADKLKMKITLSFPRNTLEKCMELFAEEIGAPVEIIGGDLQLDGITKNQSFGLDEKDQPALDILKKVMLQANKDGKLVYQIKEKDGQETLFITTRAAVEKRKEKLTPDQELPK
ncbi:MAG: serine/threonine protein kinase [Pirellulales bacterium]